MSQQLGMWRHWLIMRDAVVVFELDGVVIEDLAVFLVDADLPAAHAVGLDRDTCP